MRPGGKINASIIEIATGQRTTPSELHAAIEARAKTFSDAGLVSGKRVVLWAYPTTSFFIELLALQESGAVPFIADPNLTGPERKAMFERISPHALVDGEQIEPAAASPRPPCPSDTAFVLFTSGTSAQPKAVIHRFKNVDARLASVAAAIPAEDRKISLCFLPTYFGHGLIGICLTALRHGRELVLAPPPSLESARHVGEWSFRHRVTFISGTPSTWNLILRLSPPPTAGVLRRVQIASAHAGAELFQRVAEWSSTPVFNVYGTTETASWIADSQFRVADANIVGDGRSWGTEFRIENPGPDGIGDVRVRTSGMFAGYWGEWAPSSLPLEWYSTMDRGRIHESGKLELTGRASRLINVGGTKVSPEEVELALKSHPAVEDVAVLEVPGTSGIGQVGALVVFRPGTGSEAESWTSLHGHLVGRLSYGKIPSQWRAVAAIPRRPNGKPDLAEIGLLWSRLGKLS